MDKFNKALEKIEENYKPIKVIKRSFYPRNFQLSEDFVNSFKSEYKRLLGEGVHPKKALSRITKALLFHAND